MTAVMPTPVVLEGRYVRLEPLTLDHVPALWDAAKDPEVWRWMPVAPPASPTALTKLARYLIDSDAIVPFTVIVKETGAAAGWTTLHDVPGFDESIEIGWTWYGTAYWRTFVNTECKLLLLGHAFDKLGYDKVEFKTDHMNLRSQNAIARIGGLLEGTRRHHRRRPDGTWRDSVYFGILRDEWPDHRSRLEASQAR